VLLRPVAQDEPIMIDLIDTPDSTIPALREIIL
jgi:hypothetical protein